MPTLAGCPRAAPPSAPPRCRATSSIASRGETCALFQQQAKSDKDGQFIVDQAKMPREYQWLVVARKAKAGKG